MRTSRPVVLVASLMLVLTACQSGDGSPDPDPSSATASATTEEPNVEPYESGPESPLAYGLEVPDGAAQLGPLTRIRSARLVAAYAPDLQAALSQREADQREQAAEQAAEDEEENEGEEAAEPSASPTTPTPAPDPRPSDDSFRALEEQPRPDTVISVMRIDGKPTQVVRRMLAQISAMLPDAEVPDQLGPICEAEDQRITGCRFSVTGVTADDRDVRVDMTVDPGDVATRTSGASALTRPVMTVQITYVGDPRTGQLERESSDIADVEDIDGSADPSGLIWPAMDLDAAVDSPLVDDYTVPDDATILLSGYRPAFVELTTDRAATADLLAERWVSDRAESAVSKDVVEDLNEVSTTYSGRSGDVFYRATYVLSARGNYVLLMVYPKGVTP